MSADEGRVKRLHWLCRRGMKELDLLLEAFLAREKAALADGRWPQFEALLAQEDDILWDWFQGSAGPDDPDMGQLVQAIRQGVVRQ